MFFVISETLCVWWGKGVGVSSLPESPASTHHVSLLPPGRPCADEDMPFLNLIEILYYHYLVGISIFFLNCWTIPWSTKYQINQKFHNSTFFSYISLTWRTVPCMIMYRLRPSQSLSKSIYLSSFSVFTFIIFRHTGSFILLDIHYVLEYTCK